MTRTRRLVAAAVALAASVALAAAIAAGPAAPARAASKYVDDFEFVRDTVARDGAAPQTKKIDWAAECTRLRPLFEACANDVDHVRNVMRLLAVLRDSHTGVTDSAVRDGLPSKWDGLFGGGLRLGWDRGWVVVQGVRTGHSLEATLPAGSALVSFDGLPAWLVLEREKRRITEFQGASTDASLFGSMDNRMLPFGDKQSAEAVFLAPDGKPRRVTVPRWGPGGKAFYASDVELPEGVTWADGAISRMLATTWTKKLGYVRIIGSMDGATVTAFHAAFDAIRGMDACLLDCRAMGGGSDDCAWEMAGRFVPGGVANGRHGRIEASGSWQYDGPVVMLQDEKEVSSAETFTWAMSETGRAVSVGRTTGGWGIIPRGYRCPSGLVSFRLGVNDRPTPIRGVHTEGVGWPADVEIPMGPAIRARPDPVREIGLGVLEVLHTGAKTDRTRDAFAALFRGRIAEFPKSVAALGDVGRFDAKALATLVADDLAKRFDMEIALLRPEDDDLPPDVLGSRARLASLEPAAVAAGRKAAVTEWQAALKKLVAEGTAQEAFLAATDRTLRMEPKAREKFLAAHRTTRIARFAKERLWK